MSSKRSTQMDLIPHSPQIPSKLASFLQLVSGCYERLVQWIQLGLTNDRVMLAALCLFCGSYLLFLSDKGWIAFDEGQLAHTAERVLHGEMPHLDFDDPYTGGLAFLHAGCFHAFGNNLYSLRIPLLLLCAFAVPSMYGISRRFTPPAVAALVTLTAVVWSFPNYFASMPSWYNLCFALYGTYFIIRYAETSNVIWLVLAGLMGGLSVLFKITGLYFVAGACLFLLYREQCSRKHVDYEHERNRTPRGFIDCVLPLVLNITALGYVAAVFFLIRSRLSAMDFVNFLLPALCLSALLCLHEWKARGSFRSFLTELVYPSLLFGLAVAVPLAIFLIPFVAASGLADLFHGVFVLPQRRIASASMDFPPAVSLLAAVPLVMILLTRFPARGLFGVPYAALAVFGVLLMGTDKGYDLIFVTVRSILPIIIAIGCIQLALKSGTRSSVSGQLTFLLVVMCATTSLMQFPYSVGVYFCYVAPFVVITFSNVALNHPLPTRRIQAWTLAMYCAYGLIWLNTMPIGPPTPVTRDQLVASGLARCNLLIPEKEAKLYSAIVETIEQHSASGEFIFAANDCPEIYFLSNRRNPTRTFYQFLDSDFHLESDVRLGKIVGVLEEYSVRIVVLRWLDGFSGLPDPRLVEYVAEVFPNSKDFSLSLDSRKPSAPVFTVYWR